MRATAADDGGRGAAPASANESLESFVRLAFATDDRLSEAQSLRFYQFACSSPASRPLGDELLQLSLAAAGFMSSRSRDFAARITLAIELLTVTQLATSPIDH